MAVGGGVTDCVWLTVGLNVRVDDGEVVKVDESVTEGVRVGVDVRGGVTDAV